MTWSVLDSDAITFAGAFYAALGRGSSVKAAFDRGCNQIALTHPSGGAAAAREAAGRPKPPPVEAKVIPALVTRPGVDPSTLVFVAPEKQPFPWLWALVVLVASLVVGGVVWYFVHEPPKPVVTTGPEAPTAASVASPPVSSSAAAEIPDAGSADADASANDDAGDGGDAGRKHDVVTDLCSFNLTHPGSEVTSTCTRVPVSPAKEADLRRLGRYKNCKPIKTYKCP
jgi:hypothetical protein